MVAISVARRFLLVKSFAVYGGARRVEDDLVVLPKALEEAQRSTLAIAVAERKAKYFAEGSVPVDGAEQAVLERVDGANKIGKCVRPVDQHRDAAGRHTFPNAHRPWQRNGDVIAPTITGECDRLALIGAIIAICDETVRDHRSAEKLDRGVLQPGGQRGQARSVGAAGQNSTLARYGACSIQRPKDMPQRSSQAYISGTVYARSCGCRSASAMASGRRKSFDRCSRPEIGWSGGSA